MIFFRSISRKFLFHYSFIAIVIMALLASTGILNALAFTYAGVGEVLGDCVPGTGTINGGSTSGNRCPDPYPTVGTYGSLRGRDNAYNVFVGGNMTVVDGGAETEGLIFVYGDFNMNKPNTASNKIYNVGYSCPEKSFPQAIAVKGDGVW